MNEPDPFDERLGAALRRRAGAGTGSTDAAREAVVRRAGHVRRRRAAIGGGGALAILLVGGIALLPRGNDEIGPMDTGDVLPTFEDATTTMPELDDSGTAPTTVDLTVPAVESTTPEQAGVPGSSTGVTAPATAPTTSASSTGSNPTTTVPPSTIPSSTATTTSTPNTTDPEPTLAPFTDTYESVGGSITVRWNGSALSLQSVAPTGGFVAEVEDNSATRVRVRFESADDDSRIEVRVEGGQLRVDIG